MLSSLDLSYDPNQSCDAQIEESLREFREHYQSTLDNATTAVEVQSQDAARIAEESCYQKVTPEDGGSESSDSGTIAFDLDLDSVESGGSDQEASAIKEERIVSGPRKKKKKKKSWIRKGTFPTTTELGQRVKNFQASEKQQVEIPFPQSSSVRYKRDVEKWIPKHFPPGHSHCIKAAALPNKNRRAWIRLTKSAQDHIEDDEDSVANSPTTAQL